MVIFCEIMNEYHFHNCAIWFFYEWKKGEKLTTIVGETDFGEIFGNISFMEISLFFFPFT